MTDRPRISDSALADLLSALTHASRGSALKVIRDYDFTTEQDFRINTWLDSHVRILRGRGGQTVQWKARALECIRQLVSDGEDEADAVRKVASEFKYKLKTLQRYWRKHRSQRRTRMPRTESASPRCNRTRPLPP